MDAFAATGPMEYVPHATEGISIQVELAKVGNGYTLKLLENRKSPFVVDAFREDVAVAVDESLNQPSPDEAIDRMVDGIGAFLRSVHDEGAGEHWKSANEDRDKIRAAVKMFMPGVMPGQQIPKYVPPRQEFLVFETKKSLMEFLEKNL